MKKNNRGFSLIELIVSVAILGILTVAALGFVVSGTNGFSSISSSVNLQYKSQIAMNYIQEYLIDCNEGVYFSDADDTLYVFDSKIVMNAGTPETVYTAHIFKYDSSTQSLYYGEHTASLVSAGTLSCSNSAPDLLTDGVSSFSVTLSGATNVSDVNVTIDFFVRNKTYTGIQTIDLRNNPALVTVTVL